MRREFVVIELKAGDADRQACGRFRRTWVGERELAGPRTVRGILVAHEFTNERDSRRGWSRSDVEESTA